MKCPNCGKRIDPAAVMGAKGGKTTGASKARTSEQARAAVMARWKRLKKMKQSPDKKADDKQWLDLTVKG